MTIKSNDKEIFKLQTYMLSLIDVPRMHQFCADRYYFTFNLGKMTKIQSHISYTLLMCFCVNLCYIQNKCLNSEIVEEFIQNRIKLLYINMSYFSVMKYPRNVKGNTYRKYKL